MQEHVAPDELPMCGNCNRRRMVRDGVVAGYHITYSGCDCTLRGMFYERMQELVGQSMIHATSLGHIVIPVLEEDNNDSEGESGGTGDSTS